MVRWERSHSSEIGRIFLSRVALWRQRQDHALASGPCKCNCCKSSKEQKGVKKEETKRPPVKLTSVGRRDARDVPTVFLLLTSTMMSISMLFSILSQVFPPKPRWTADNIPDLTGKVHSTPCILRPSNASRRTGIFRYRRNEWHRQGDSEGKSTLEVRIRGTLKILLLGAPPTQRDGLRRC